MTETRHFFSPERRQAVERHTRGIVERLQAGFLRDRPDARAQLARLRNALEAPLSARPEVFATVFTELPEDLEGRGEEPNEAELAIHTAVCLYAIHQQSRSEQPMHVQSDGNRRRSLGYGVSRLGKVATGEDQDKPIVRRFNAIITADGFVEIRHHLRGIVQLLRSGRDGTPVPLDYALLAADLYELQFPAQRDGVRLCWSRDALRSRREHEQEAGAGEQNEPGHAAVEDA